MSLLPSPRRRRPVRCSYCREGFREPRDLALHRGRVHREELDEGERASFEAALDEEARWLAGFRHHTRAGLAALAILVAYAAVVVTGYVYRANPFLVVLPLPGILGFAALTYLLVYRRQAAG